MICMGTRLDKQLREIDMTPIPRMMKDTARSSATHCYTAGRLDAADEIFAELDRLLGLPDGFDKAEFDKLKAKFKEEERKWK